jgi:HrpA-like RNA helicase
MPLLGSMPPEAQDRAIAEAPPGERKIVLATTLAESSVTVRGVRIVIDSGLSRVPRFSPRTGMARLETVPVSIASADQRRGRAGREAPGVCYRLWTEQEHRQLQPQSDPELLGADLSPLALELAVWGIADPAELAWLDRPPAAAYAQALELLRALGALDEKGRPTAHGRAMAALGMHPRLAHMVLEADKLGHGSTACELAALLSDRDPLRSSRSIDMRLRLDALHGELPLRRRSGCARPAFGRAQPPVKPLQTTSRILQASCSRLLILTGSHSGAATAGSCCAVGAERSCPSFSLYPAPRIWRRPSWRTAGRTAGSSWPRRSVWLSSSS